MTTRMTAAELSMGDRFSIPSDKNERCTFIVTEILDDGTRIGQPVEFNGWCQYRGRYSRPATPADRIAKQPAHWSVVREA